MQGICSLQFPALTSSNSRVETLVNDLKTQFDQLSASHSSGANEGQQMAEILREQTQTMSRIEDLVQLKDDDDGKNIDLKDDLNAIKTRMSSIEQRLERLETPENTQQEILISHFEEMKKTLKRIEEAGRAVKKQDSSAEGLEQILNRLVGSGSQMTVARNSLNQSSNGNQQLQPPLTNSSESLISVQTTMMIGNRKTCRNTCKCRCHEQSQIRTSGLLSKIVGNFFLSYNYLPILKPRSCNRPTCLRNPKDSISLSFILPSWMLRKRLAFFLSWSSVAGAGATLHYSVPRLNDRLWEVAMMLRDGRSQLLLKCIGSGRFLPTDVDQEGFTLLYVRGIHFVIDLIGLGC